MLNLTFKFLAFVFSKKIGESSLAMMNCSLEVIISQLESNLDFPRSINLEMPIS